MIGEFADAIVENPVFDLLKLEDTNSNFIRLTLARSTKTPPEVLAELIATENSDFEVCYVVANNINTPINALGNLAIEIANGTNGRLYPNQSNSIDDSENWLYLVIDIIDNHNISESCLEKVLDISIDRNHRGLLEISLDILNLFNLSYRMLEKLSLYQKDRPEIQVGGYGYLLIDLPTVNKSPILIDNIARNTSQFKEDVFLKIANNSITSTRTIEYIAAHSSHNVRNALINHPNVSRKALDIILFMQGKPGTSVELLHELANNLRFRVLNKLCTYPIVPSEILDIVSNNLPVMFPHGTYRWLILTHLAYHPNSSNNLLQKIIKELEEVGSFISNGYPPENYYNVSYANFEKAVALKKADDLKKINKLTKKIVRRLKGEHLTKTNKIRVAFKKADDLQEINKLTKKIVRRLKGEHLAETDKIRAYWAIATEQNTTEDRYSWENLYQSDLLTTN